MEKTFDEDDNSLPKLPEISVGSSVSTDLENEYNELLHYTLVTHKIDDDQKQGPSILENSIGLYLTNEILEKIEENFSRSIENSFKIDEVIKNLDTAQNKPNESVSESVITLNLFKEDDSDLRLIEASLLEKNKVILKNKEESNQTEQTKQLNNNQREEVEEKIKDSKSTDVTNIDSTPTSDGQLQSILNKNSNSITIVSDLANATTQSESVISKDIKESILNDKALLENIKEMTNMNCSFTSPSSSQTSTSTSSSNNESELINQYYNKYQQNFDSSSDVNPRKNSPIPASPPTNIELENDTSSLEHLSSLNNVNYESISAFRKINTDTNQGNLNRNFDSNIQIGANRSGNNSNKANLMNNLFNEQSKNVKIASCLDKWYKELKGHVLSEFEKSRLQIFQEQQKKLIEEKEKQTNEINKLKKELELLKETVKIHERNLLKKDEAIENVTKAFEKQREKNELQRVMMDWKLKRVENAKETFTVNLADKFYSQRLKLKIFFKWQNFLINKHKIKVEKACKKKAEEVCLDLATKYENKIKKLEDELNMSKLEIEKYKIEMAKNEENMKKALMRGVCALNLEAMSIFNENDQINENSLLLNTIQKQNEIFNTSNLNKNNLLRPGNLNVLNRKMSELETKELSKKVKNYCETNFSNNKSINQSSNTNSNNISAIAKAKMQLLNSNSKNIEQIQDKISSDSEILHENNKVISNNKIFDELIEHPITLQSKSLNKHSSVKSKIGSLVSNKSSLSNSLSSSLPPYRSVIIEKHTNNLNLNEEGSIKTSTSKVKYTPPMQPAKVLNTVISTSIS